MSADAAVKDIIAGIDWSKPDSGGVNGERVYSVRCRVPFSVPAGMTATVRAVSAHGDAVSLVDTAAEMGVTLRDLHDVGHNGDGGDRVIVDTGDGIELPDDATGDTGADDEVPFDDILISGIASSTSVDFYGTEMSLRALKIMAVQMMASNGVPYVPRHNSADGPMEWDDVIGRTMHAEVVPAERVAKAFNEAESQFMLRVTIRLYGDEPQSKSLMRRIMRGEPIGQSIGGWFTHLQVIQSADGEVERVIVQAVDLDHLAVTRGPANPDSIGIVSLRDALQVSANEHSVKMDCLRDAVVDGQSITCSESDGIRLLSRMEVSRHILAAQNNGDGTVTLVLAVADVGDEAEESRSADIASDASAPIDNLDNNVGTAHDTGIDARRSAPTDQFPPTSAHADTPSEEYAMTEQDLQNLQAAVRSAVSDATAPLIERVDSLEAAARAVAPTEAAVEIVTPSTNDLVLEARKVADAAIARAKNAEAALVDANKRPLRVGRSVTPSIAGHTGIGAANQLVERSRQSAPTLAAVAERCIEAITDAPVPGTKVTRAQLDAALSGMLCAAETDGIITDPSHRAVWS